MPTLNWIGKDAVVEHHRRVSLRLLECDRELSPGKATLGRMNVTFRQTPYALREG